MIASLFGAHLVIFHAPLLFLYIKSLNDRNSVTWVHFAFPILYTGVYLVLKIYFSSFFSTYG
ncbi:MAG: hypothetical protein AAFQ20_09585, partial [Bacteroidota bacterium]